MKSALTLLFLLLLAAPQAWGLCETNAMVRVVYQNATPGLAEDSLETAPKTLYRLGTKFGRLEQATRIGVETHGLRITNVPDSWIIDTITETGRYSYDASGSLHFRAPVFPAYEDAEFLSTLEFGCELAFMIEHSTEPPIEAEITEKKLLNYTVRNGRYRVHLAVLEESRRPVGVGLFEGEEMLQYIRYVDYRHLPFNPGLFYPPADMKIEVVD
jgi:hypothetical protein